MGQLKEKSSYNRYYGDFKGVDFSSDHSQVHEQRLAYSVNMFRDYQSGQGQALETICGFRQRAFFPDENGKENAIYGIYSYKFTDGTEQKTRIVVHAGTSLYLWHNYPKSLEIPIVKNVTLNAPVGSIASLNTYEISLNDCTIESVDSVKTIDGADILEWEYDDDTKNLTFNSSLMEGDNIQIIYREGVLGSSIYDNMNERRSSAFIMNNLLYVIDGKNYVVYDGETASNVLDNVYIPTTYINIVPSGSNANNGVEYEQRNMLTPKFISTFIPDGTTKTFKLNENELESVDVVKLYDRELDSTEFSVSLTTGEITFNEAPAVSDEYPSEYAGLIVTASKRYTSIKGVATGVVTDVAELITGCTICAVFDNRVFLSGNPLCPNHVFFCGRNALSGLADATYFGVLNTMQDGVGDAPITGMMSVADTLMVLRNDTLQEGSTYFHTPYDTDNDVMPRAYQTKQGLAGIGCLGACINFLDDPVFISRLGVEAVAQLSVRNERANEHRSSLVDAKLANSNLEKSILGEWNGYLLLLIDGDLYLADSRQKYQHSIGVPQYEWYFVEGVGVYQNQYPEYKYSKGIPEALIGINVNYCTNCHSDVEHCTCSNPNHIEIRLESAEFIETRFGDAVSYEDLRGEVVNAPMSNGEQSSDVTILNGFTTEEFEVGDRTAQMKYYYTYVVKAIRDLEDVSQKIVGYKAYLCEHEGNYIGGVFKQATTILNLENNIFFGTENGVICSFNFDKRDETGTIPAQWYTFDNRTIYCGCATKMDCCNIPHLTKTTVKRSTVIKTKSFRSSAAKIKVRTNKKPYEQVDRINNSIFSFEDLDFSDLTFNLTEQSLFAVNEKEKKWVEKQYFIYSDEFMKPFALFYVAFRYVIAGRFKN